MLAYVEELKKYVEEMLIWDGKVRAAKSNLRAKSKTATKQELEQLKNIVKGSVAFKLRSYLELCALVDRYNVFWGRDILKALPGYRGEGYALVAEKWQKEILKEYIRKNGAMTKNIAYLVNLEKLFEKSTGTKWVARRVKSPYTYQDRQDIAGTRIPSCWHLLIDENYADLLQDQVLTPEKVKEYILDGKCVLLTDLYTENNEKVIEKRYIFDMSMDTIGNTIYEKMYPNLRYNFWELFNERIIATIQNEIKNRESNIVDANNSIKDNQRKIERQRDDIEKLKDILEDEK